MKAIINATIKDSNMWPLTETTHTLLIPIFNKPLILNYINILKNHIDEFIIVIKKDKKAEKLQDFIKAEVLETKITFITLEEDETHSWINGLMNRPELYDVFEERGEREEHEITKTNKDLIIVNEYAFLAKEDIENLILDKSSCLNHEEISLGINNVLNTGLFHIKSDLLNLCFKDLQSQQKEISFENLLTLYSLKQEIKNLTSLYNLPLKYSWQILNVHEKLSDTVIYANEGIIEENVVIKGRLKIGKGSIIKSGTYIEGDVIIGCDCVIGPNAYIRGVSVIGDNSKIGFSCEIKNFTIFSDVSIPHLSYLGDSILGNNVNFSGGSITSNLRHDNAHIKSMIDNVLIDTGRRKFGTVIGNNTKLGISTKIYPGRKIGPNLTTIPGQIVSKDIKN